MESERVKLRIYGMTCDDCVATVTKGLKNQDGVLDVRVSLKDGVGDVVIDPEKVNPEMLLKNGVFTKPSHYRATIEDQ
jgi:copper chaperone CopZ